MADQGASLRDLKALRSAAIFHEVDFRHNSSPHVSR